MRKLKELTLSLTLVLVCAVAAIGGEIHVPGPPPPPSASFSVPVESDNKSPGINREPVATGSSVTEVALNLLQDLISVF